MKRSLFILAVLFSTLTAPAGAQTYQQTFESTDASYFQQPVSGLECNGTSITISPARAHSGSRSAHLAYSFSDQGNIDLVISAPVVVAQTGTVLHFSMWVYGANQNDFPMGGGLLLVDGGDETFQYWLGKPLADTLDGAGWKEISADIDLTKPTGHWGGKNSTAIQWPLRFLGLGLDHSENVPAHGEVFIDDLTLSTGKAVKKNAAEIQSLGNLVLKVNSPGCAFTAPGKLIHVEVSLPDLPESATASGAKLHWEAKNFYGTQTAKGVCMLDAQGNGRFTVTPESSGIYYIYAVICEADGAEAARGHTQIAAYPPGNSASAAQNSAQPLLFGISAHLEGLSPADANREIAWMSVLGFRACRLDCSWGMIQPAKGVWKWDTYDRLFYLLKYYGIAPEGVLAYSAKWASTGNLASTNEADWENAPPRIPDYAEFARQCAVRYGSTTRYWEVWNEPDLPSWTGTPEQYAHLFDAAYTAIKGAEPTAVVLNGGISEVGRLDFVPRWLAASQTKPDVFAYHSHGPFPGMVRASATIQSDLKSALLTRPVWINEAGFSTTTATTEQDQAFALVKKISYAASIGNEAYYWYDLINDGDDPDNNEHNFGLLLSDFTPKSSAVAVRVLIDTLSGYRFVRRVHIQENPNIYALLFGSPTSQSGVVVLWNEGQSSVPLLFSVPGKVQHISLMGNVSTIRKSRGLIALAASREPQFIRFEGNLRQLKSISSILDLPAQLIVTSNETTRFMVVASNSLPSPLKGVITIAAPQGCRLGSSKFSVDLRPGERKEFYVSLMAPHNPFLHEILSVSLVAASLPTTIQGSMLISGAIAVPRVSTDPTLLGDVSAWASPTVSLGQAHLISLYVNAPLANMLFHGDDDLSAMVYVSRVPSGLRLRVRVRDDMFYQNEPLGAEWQGDSIQFALALPGGQNYEWTAALTAHGPIADLELAPYNVALGVSKFPLAIKRNKYSKETLYDLIVPAILPGGATLGSHFSMTLLVNDDDGAGRKGWVEWTPGIGRSKDPSQYQPIEVL